MTVPGAEAQVTAVCYGFNDPVYFCCCCFGHILDDFFLLIMYIVAEEAGVGMARLQYLTNGFSYERRL